MAIEIKPFVGAAGLRFGMTRDETTGVFGEEYTEFRRVPDSPVVHDYEHDGIQLNFDNNNRLEFIEIFPEAQPFLNGIDMCSLDAKSLRALLGGRTSVVSVSEGFRLPAFGVAVYAPETMVEAVAVHCKDYYSDARSSPGSRVLEVPDPGSSGSSSDPDPGSFGFSQRNNVGR